MKKQIKHLLLILTLILLVGSATAQQSRWRELSGRQLVRFDWNCASKAAYPRTQLNRLVQTTLRRESGAGFQWADRAFAFDLNKDGKPEYFVPLDCGATGNCGWGVFGLRPPRLLGTLGGEQIYAHQRAGHWPAIITYTHLSAAEGVLATYRFTRRRYVWIGDEYPVGGAFLEIQHVKGHRMPKFLDRARVACAEVGN